MLASRPVSAVATRLFGYGTPIFMMHRFVPDVSSKKGHTPNYLRRCLQFLKDNGHTFVSLEDILNAIRNGTLLPRKPVAFTMDDGFSDQATLAAPVFSEFDCPVTIFLISGMLDGQLWPWDDKVAYIMKNSVADTIEVTIRKQYCMFKLDNEPNIEHAISTTQNIMKTMDGKSISATIQMLAEAAETTVPEIAPYDYQPMTWDMVRALEKDGINFAPHTISHRILSKLNAKDSEIEIVKSWQRLKDELTSPVPIFCYPTGRPSDYGTREIDLLRKMHFLGAVSTVPNYVNLQNKTTKHLYSLPRFGLPDTFDNFIQYCTWIEHAKSKVLNRH